MGQPKVVQVSDDRGHGRTQPGDLPWRQGHFSEIDTVHGSQGQGRVLPAVVDRCERNETRVMQLDEQDTFACQTVNLFG